jgi:hypothetical protein
MAFRARFDRSRRRLIACVGILLVGSTGCMLDELVGSDASEPNDSPPPAPGPNPPAAPGAAAVIARGQGSGQTDTVASTLSQPYEARVTDAQGRPVPGVTVVWAVTSGSGTIAPSTSVTNANGLAVATHTLGTTAGPQAVVASVAGVGSASFAAVASHATPAALEFVVQPTNVRVDQRVTPAVRIRARDRFGNTAIAFEEDLTIEVAPGTGTPGAKIRGSTEDEADDGVATFDDIKIRLPGLGMSGQSNTLNAAEVADRPPPETRRR